MDREADRAERAQAGRLTRLPENARDTTDHRRSGAAQWIYLFQSRCIGLALPAENCCCWMSAQKQSPQPSSLPIPMPGACPEIAQLTVTDIGTEGGVPFISITDFGEG